MKYVHYLIILFSSFILLLSSVSIGFSETPKDHSSSAQIDDFEDDDFSDDANSDFSDDDFSDDSSIGDTIPDRSSRKPSTQWLPSFITVNGYLKLSSTYNTDHETPVAGQMDWRELSKLKTELFLESNISLYKSWRMKVSGTGFYDAAYDINDHENVTDEVRDEYESGGDLKKAYIEGKITDWLDIKIGRQIVAWGKSDSMQINDILNPLNLQEPKPSNVEDLDNLRLPVVMTRFDTYKGDWNLTAIAIHERRFNKIPEFGSDYYPVPTQQPPNEIEPSGHVSETEFAVSLSGTFSGWDAAFYFADVYSNEAHLTITPLPLVLTNPNNRIEWEYARIKMFGADLNVAKGNWLLKAESAWFSGIILSDLPIPGFPLPLTVPLSSDDHSRNKTMAGIEYSGFKDTTITASIMNDHLGGIGMVEKAFKIKENSFQATARVSRNFMNERLELIASASMYGEKAEDGSMYRFTAEFEITDNLLVNGGMIFYEGGDNPLFEAFKNNDRISVDIKYSF